MPKPTPPYDLAVIGGGAAGFFGAVVCAEARPGTRITILEKANAVLAKVRISGGGRCNVTHAEFDPSVLAGAYPRGSRELTGLFRRFQPRDAMRWFERRGAPLKTEPDRRVFPASDLSQTIINLFLDAAQQHRMDILTRTAVASILPPTGREHHFRIETASGESLRARAVLLASGGDRAGMALAESLGHTLEPPVPSLFTLKVRDARIDGLAGISVTDAELRLPSANLRQRGPLLVTHWGLSGPATLKLSAWGARYLYESSYSAPLLINWLPDSNPDAAFHALMDVKQSNPRQKASAHAAFASLPQRLWARLVEAAGIAADEPWGGVSRQKMNALASQLTRGEYQISGKGEFKEEFVTCGGVRLKEVDFKTMQSAACPGLFLAGEVLDIDGITGGYNFQAAWSTGFVAGQAIAAALSATGVEPVKKTRL